MNEELDSQLSAMFDDELDHAECELLARRLSRDAELKARWGRYAMIAAAVRAERGVRLHAQVARRVSAIVVAEPALAAPVGARARQLRWWRPVAGAAVAAGVAAVAILCLRWYAPGDVTVPPEQTASVTPVPAPALPQATQTARATAVRPTTGPPSYVVPPAPSGAVAAVPPTELANYVVAHSMFSSPVTRGNILTAFITGESAAAGNVPVSQELPEDAPRNAQSHAR